MTQYERLSEENRNSRRTIADIIEVLRNEGGFCDDDRAQIRVGLGKLPSAEVVGVVQILFDRPSDDRGYVVSLPTSTHFRARSPNSSRCDRFDIQILDKATVDSTGNVLLADGSALCAVEVVPCRLPVTPSKLDWRIVHYTISLIKPEWPCYRSLRDDFSPEDQNTIPDLRLLDCGRLVGLTVPPVNVISLLIREKDPTLKKLSEQQIANTLRKFGIRIPVVRTRKARHGAAAI
jgi:hypothetical protein